MKRFLSKTVAPESTNFGHVFLVNDYSGNVAT